jgi:hypothetical protein
MSEITTPVRETVRVRQIREHIERMLNIKPDVKCVALAQRSYDEYKAACCGAWMIPERDLNK